MTTTIYFPKTIARFDEAVSRVFSYGVGARDGQMCVEAAVCYALDLPHGDDPGCVAESVRRFKIRLNDASWSSPRARADGLRDLGIAQLGSRGVVDELGFARRVADCADSQTILAELTILAALSMVTVPVGK